MEYFCLDGFGVFELGFEDVFYFSGSWKGDIVDFGVEFVLCRKFFVWEYFSGVFDFVMFVSLK